MNQDLNTSAETQKKTGINLHNPGLDNDLVDMTLKVQVTKEKKQNHWTSSK
jgi:hypothetical protein